MPSRRKRIGYLPSIHTQEIISNLAKKEKLSQSKVVGLLVEEALSARREYNINNSIRNHSYKKERHMIDSNINHNDLDELISDNGITYKVKKT